MIANYCQTLTGSFASTSFASILDIPQANWMGVVYAGLLVSALGLVVLYILSHLIRLPKVEAWVKFELFQLLATLVLTLFIAGWVFGMCHWDASILDKNMYQGTDRAAIIDNCNGIVSGHTQQGAVNMTALDKNGNARPILTPYCVAQYYLTKVKARGDDVFQLLFYVNYGTSMLFKTVWESRPLGIGYTLEPLAGFQQLQNVFLVAVSGFTVAYVSVLIQMRVLDFLLISVPFFFMPLGLLLRAFPPTREFGGAVVGFGMASLLFFPLVLVMDDLIVYSTLESVVRPAGLAMGNVTEMAADNYTGSFQYAAHPLESIAKGDAMMPGGPPVLGTDRKPLVVQNLLTTRAQAEQYRVVLFTGSDNQAYLINITDGTWAALYHRGHTADPMSGGAQINQLLGEFDVPNTPGTDKYGLRADAGTTMTRNADYFTTPQSDSNPGLLQRLSDTIFGAFNILMVYFVTAVFLPVINFLVYIETARSFSKFLGSELDLSNLARLI